VIVSADNAGAARIRVVVCLPTYDERENIEPLIRALGEVLDTSTDRVLVIDDNSPDGTGDIADRLAAELPWLSVLHRERKEGIGPPTSQAFAGHWQPERSSCSRWTATSRTTRRTSPG